MLCSCLAALQQAWNFPSLFASFKVPEHEVVCFDKGVLRTISAQKMGVQRALT